MSLPVEAIQRENSLSGRKVLNTASSRRISARAARSIRAPGGPALHALETHRSSSEVPRTFSWCAECARGSPGRRIVRRVMHPGWRTCKWEDGKLRLSAEHRVGARRREGKRVGMGRNGPGRKHPAGRPDGSPGTPPHFRLPHPPRCDRARSRVPPAGPSGPRTVICCTANRGCPYAPGGVPLGRGFPSRTRGIQGHQGRSLRRSEITRYAIPPKTSAKTTRANHSR